ncbi:hypothetical protein [Xanthomonas phage OP1]|uniref:Uncharacterized protein n=1 Tax=Xanthomonas phage OP1 TaxID=2994040 RepID=Q2NPD5_9CAUD|nr:hypothetical protein OP1_ORF56 [Xanthomonas phage OP1]BAE72761.1 hypothetical protein [Xanthomonas phage OP1]
MQSLSGGIRRIEMSSTKSTTLKLQINEGKVVDLKATWEEDVGQYRITCKELHGFVAYSPYLSEAKKHILAAIWQTQGNC